MTQPPRVGRPSGAPNIVTANIRESFYGFLESSVPNMVEWINRVAETDPAKALDCIHKMAEYVLPKLTKEVDGVGKNSTITIVHSIPLSPNSTPTLKTIDVTSNDD